MTNYPAPPPLVDGNTTQATSNLPTCDTPHCASRTAPRLVLVYAGHHGPSRAWMCQPCERIATDAGAVVARLSSRYAEREQAGDEPLFSLDSGAPSCAGF